MNMPFTRDIPADRLYSSRQIADALGRLTIQGNCPGSCDREMNKIVTVGESRTVIAHGIFNNNISSGNLTIEEYI